MSFASPGWLLALLAIPLLGLYVVQQQRRRRQFAVRHPAAAVVAAVLPRVPRYRRWVPTALLAAAAAVLAVALARPQRTVAVPVDKASVVLVTDESGSMSATDVSPSRIEAVANAARSFMDKVPDELQVGFIGFSATVQGVVEPTTDHAQIRAQIDALAADGGTATGDALTAALDRLQRRRGTDGSVAPAAIVLLSDGKTTAGSDPVRAAMRAGRLKIPVFTVALGTDDGVVFGPGGQAIAVPPDPETLREIARRSGGQTFQVDDADELGAVYEALGSKIGTKDEQREITAAFAAGGLLLLLGGLGTSLRWRGRLV